MPLHLLCRSLLYNEMHMYMYCKLHKSWFFLPRQQRTVLDHAGDIQTPGPQNLGTHGLLRGATGLHSDHQGREPARREPGPDVETGPQQDAASRDPQCDGGTNAFWFYSSQLQNNNSAE